MAGFRVGVDIPKGESYVIKKEHKRRVRGGTTVVENEVERRVKKYLR